MFFTDFAAIYNDLIKKLQGRGQTVLTMFDNIKIFEKKIETFCKDLQNENLKYFLYLKKQLINSKHFKDNQLDMKLMITKYVKILKNAYELFSIRFSQFHQLDSTLEFLINPHNIKFYLNLVFLSG